MTDQELRAAYESGTTVESLSLDESQHTTSIRARLRIVGTEMRKCGQRKGSSTHHRANLKPKMDSTPAIQMVPSKTQRTGHRRKGWA